jgi:uridine phosphorylase
MAVPPFGGSVRGDGLGLKSRRPTVAEPTHRRHREPDNVRDDLMPLPTDSAPILRAKDYAASSVFQPENLLREARRQKDLAPGGIPAVCLLDPDGDLVRALRGSGRAMLSPHWACYHTELWLFACGTEQMGVVGCAVGGSFAVLVAEQLFASGCRLLISVTSAGQIGESGATPYFVLIERALRDEGTSYHYLPPSDFSPAPATLLDPVFVALSATDLPIQRGAAWTTDAPFRETTAAIEAARAHGVLAVEMEAASLYAFAAARDRDVLCFAHVTNQMAQVEGDFEKGEASGTRDMLRLVETTAAAWRAIRRT